MKKIFLIIFALLLMQQTVFADSVDYLQHIAELSPGESDCDWAAIALKTSNAEFNSSSYAQALEEYIAKKYASDNTLSKNKATEYHRISIAASAVGLDVTNVGGHNLIDDGIFKNSSLSRQGINAYIWALIAIASNDYNLKSPENIISEILSKQNEDGGFSLSGNISDTDITAMAITALSQFQDYNKVYSAIERATDCLIKLQCDNGGFMSYGVENAESCAQTIIALSSIGIDVSSDVRFIKNGKNPIDALREYELDNGFSHIIGGEINPMATSQAVIALAAYNKKDFVYGFELPIKETDSTTPIYNETLETKTKIQEDNVPKEKETKPLTVEDNFVENETETFSLESDVVENETETFDIVIGEGNSSPLIIIIPLALFCAAIAIYAGKKYAEK